MVIISKGFGWLVIVIVVGFSLIANLLFNAVYGEGYYDHHKWPVGLSLIISGAFSWFTGLYLKARSDRVAVDLQTGQQVVINQSRHTLFFIPMQFWGIILAFIGLVLIATEMVKRSALRRLRFARAGNRETESDPLSMI